MGETALMMWINNGLPQFNPAYRHKLMVIRWRGQPLGSEGGHVLLGRLDGPPQQLQNPPYIARGGGDLHASQAEVYGWMDGWMDGTPHDTHRVYPGISPLDAP